MMLAPIALFTYNRLWHTWQTIEALQKNFLADTSELFIFSDGPLSEVDKENVLKVREYIKTITGFKNITIIEREHNLGLAQSIISGVTEIVNRYGRIIVLEDDLVCSPYFLKYMNEALELYESEDDVISISGYMYPIKSRLPETFFIKSAECWGWGTWKRSWNQFEIDGKKLLKEIRKQKLESKFDLDGSYPYTRMLKNQVAGRNQSWAIRWYASAFLNNKLTLYPGRSLIKNIGNDYSGIHSRKTDIFDVDIAMESIDLKSIPIEENLYAREEIRKFLKGFPMLLNRIQAKLVKLFNYNNI